MSFKSSSDFISEIEKCKLCKACEGMCSVFLTKGKYSPHEKLIAVRNLINDAKKPENWETVFFCTKCEACDVECPEDIPITKIIDLGRKLCVEKWGIQYPKQKDVNTNIIETGNPFGKLESRMEWLNNEYSETSRTLLHIGCMISYPLKSIGESIVKILKKLKIDFTISPNEGCCGYFIYNTGNHPAAQTIIDQNVKEFKQYNKLIVACAGCYTFLKDHYNLKMEIRHLIEVIWERIEELNLKLKSKECSAIFQDSCHISRLHGILEPPRKLLKMMKIELNEFDKALCCGANGGMRIINPNLALEIGKNRLTEAKEKSGLLLTLCPFCIHNLRDAAETYGINIQIGSIFEILEDLLP